MTRGVVRPGRSTARSGGGWHRVVRRGAAAWAALALVAGACVAAQVEALLPASAALSHAITIAVGANDTCTIRNGSAYCWGSNANGQLGNNTTSSSVPVAVTASGVLSGTVLSQISAGSSSACALDTVGAAYCWGGNGSGQLGNNSVTQSNVPVAVTTSGRIPGRHGVADLRGRRVRGPRRGQGTCRAGGERARASGRDQLARGIGHVTVRDGLGGCPGAGDEAGR